ncbi:ABC transporter ATP-binding protein [Pantoea sp. App145]|uniref:ABC transporter ATP-binding protein n=1 Tax=Pantoea sp. App145 TaxID=3071567 RepID=UPI003A812C5C
MSALLQAHKLDIGYQHSGKVTRLMQHFDFTLSENEIVAVVGSSGVGKSSLLRILAGLEKPLSGEVTWLGKVLTGPHPRLSVAFQDATLLPWLTLEQNVAFGLDFRHQPRISASQRQTRIMKAIESVGLIQHLGKMPAQLSGGMAQRVALARCLARLPKVMLLDEPFSALDEITRHDMQRLLISVLRQHRMSALLITHDIDEALLVADRIILLGGQPGQIMGIWRLPLPYPRDNLLEDLAKYRIEILKKLHELTRKNDVEKYNVPDV